MNLLNADEFIEGTDGMVQYNDQFWQGQKMFKHLNRGGKLVFLEMCLYVSEFVLRREQLAPHREAVTWFQDHGCGVGGKFIKVTAYKDMLRSCCRF
jgi:hypothetical protein